MRRESEPKNSPKRVPLISTSKFLIQNQPCKSRYSLHAQYDWKENLAHAFSSQHRTTDPVNHQMVPVSGSQCGRCLDHDSTNLSTSTVILKLGRDSTTDSKLQLGWSHCKAGGVFFISDIPSYCCADLHFKKNTLYQCRRENITEDFRYPVRW